MSNQAVALQTERKAPVVAPELEADFAAYIDEWHPSKTLPAAVVQRAMKIACEFETYLAPADPIDIELWLHSLRKGITAMSEKEFSDRVAAIIVASGDLPAWVWSAESLKDCLRDPGCRYMSSSSVDGKLRPRARAARHAAWLAQQAAKARVAADAFDATKAVPAGLLPSLAAELRMPAGVVSDASSKPFQPAGPARAPSPNIPARPLSPEVRAALRSDPNLRVSMARGE